MFQAATLGLSLCSMQVCLRLLSSSGGGIAAHKDSQCACILAQVRGFLCVFTLVCVSVSPHRLSVASFVSILACPGMSLCAVLCGCMYLGHPVGEYLGMLYVNWHGGCLYVACSNYLSLSLLGFICVWVVWRE